MSDSVARTADDRTPIVLTATSLRFHVRDPVSGFSHLGGLVASVVALAWLFGRGARGPGGSALLLVYGAGLISVYLASALYHLIPASSRVARRLRLFDHLSIFVMVAGTSTPLFVRALDGVARVVMLTLVWGLALVGAVFKVAAPRAPRWASTSFYVAMGWCVVVQWSRIQAGLPLAAIALLVAGGLAYTVGALVYGLKRPNPIPRVIGFHEVWHFFVLLGSALHFGAIALVV